MNTERRGVHIENIKLKRKLRQGDHPPHTGDPSPTEPPRTGQGEAGTHPNGASHGTKDTSLREAGATKVVGKESREGGQAAASTSKSCSQPSSKGSNGSTRGSNGNTSRASSIGNRIGGMSHTERSHSGRSGGDGNNHRSRQFRTHAGLNSPAYRTRDSNNRGPA